ncbi:MFS transporter [Symbioplanes lichenis]|uniref:MFS transporter n=1 Tax=Symbioplanes lichenis TaxID=1629072 RepID=UPI0027387E85|nr:MFS transporter [Actinoplanes lichenis]
MILRRPYTLTTAGAWSLVFLAAFESLAVTTVMPQVTAELGGRGQYALAFSSALATGVIGMVGFGGWADRRGPAAPLLTAVAVFALGLVIAGTATSMPAFIAGRLVQGLGAGGHTVVLYVLVARVYPPDLHLKVFGAFSTAWVLPSLIGPFVAGLVADAVGWRWVFLGVVALVVVATVLILPALAGHTTGEPGPFDMRRLVTAAVAAVSVVAMGAVAWYWMPVALAVTLVALRPLVPGGTFQLRRGLPAAVALPAFAGGVFIGTDVYLPLLLQERYGLPPWLSGITLTVGAVAWAGASMMQGRLGERLNAGTAVRAGALLLAAGAGVVLLTVVAHLPLAVAVVGWFVAGAGMGTMYPRISALVLGWSAPGQQGFHTAAKSISETIGTSATLAVTGLLAGAGPFLCTALLSVALVAVAMRVQQPVAADQATPVLQ